MSIFKGWMSNIWLRVILIIVVVLFITNCVLYFSSKFVVCKYNCNNVLCVREPLGPSPCSISQTIRNGKLVTEAACLPVEEVCRQRKFIDNFNNFIKFPLK